MTKGHKLPISELARFRAQRLKQVYWITLTGLGIAIFANWQISSDLPTLAILVLGECVLIWGLRDLKNNKINQAAAILLWTLSLSLTGSIVINSGLRDPALLAYPAILIFAALFGNTRLFVSLFSFLILSVIFVGASDIYQWKEFNQAALNWTAISDALIILLIIGLTVRFQAADLRNALTRLEHENEKFRVSEAKASYLAQYDSLTGLPNRALCENRFNLALHTLQRRGGICALLFIDLDNFKTINDSLGHSVGDAVLKTIADRITDNIRASDTACRFGGDEFIVILTDLQDATQAERISTKLLKALSKPLELEQHFIDTSASIGIVLAPQDGDSFDAYCKNADIAMYQAKADGKNLCRFFNDQMNTLSQERFELITGLRLAIKRQEFRLHYQPKIALDSGQWVGAEALLRWQHPEKGLLAPAVFMALAEETGLIIDIGKWVLQQACTQCRAWHDQGFASLDIAVNLSSVQFSRGNLEREVKKALKKSDLDGQFLELELTESLLLGDAEKVRIQVDKLRAHGVSFSIDDFGTGYSNLGYLSKFDIESLKIDQSFVRKILDSEQDLNITIAIINFAKSLGLTTVAEGIEDAEIMAKLAVLGCDLGQGYYWSKPLDAETFTSLLRQNHASSGQDSPTPAVPDLNH
ncbi:EAL domain-containing protein [Simiduia curdlanivorans]|uniref:Bifunctional diguanylate cyclase/phosphodiesterase n=1 Tax=Simiduia curdlanivorans TaxID=1492769 RepID=A0ABV8V3W7_9GAMM|nr:EAL domain-containing protein [Simiduia curdlanivorans]MDN3641032.1 EAL domain-containing protein [Simiduia curdlanivorans]